MSITMQQIDACIDTTINRLSSESGRMHSSFYFNLRDQNPGRMRITEKLVAQAIDLCESRGLHVERNGDGLTVIVDLNRCSLNPRQAELFNAALDYTRSVHGNML